MANVLMIMDPDESRRTAYIEAVRSAVALVPGLKLGEVDSGLVGVVWAAGAQAPVSAVSDAAGGAVLWGDAIAGASAVRATAAEVRAAWSRPGPAAVWDGFYAAVQWDAAGTLTVGADPLGLFPIYWWSDGEVLLMGTSAELFGRHPRYEPRLDAAGLAGVLLTNGLVGGRTLWRGVRRLGPGRVLRGGGRAALREEVQYELPLTRRYEDLPLRGQVDVLGEALSEAMARHAPPGRAYGILLSGGLDSRMLAGFLAEQHAEVEALTMGRRSDFEMKCARAVARFLGYPQRTMDLPPERYPALADRLARWEHLASGFNGVPDWAIHEGARRLPSRTVTGYLADAIVGGSHVSWAYDPATRSMSFATFFNRVNEWAFRPDDVIDLLPHRSFRAAVDETVATLEAEYLESAELESQRAWSFDLRLRQRFHVGGTAWLTSFGSWPVLPVSDRKVLEVVAGMPSASLSDRRLQSELVAIRFPSLARLPLDRNSANIRPLRPGLRYRLVEFARGRFRHIHPRWEDSAGARRNERRYYYRAYGFDSPGWLAVRRHAEPARARLEAIADATQLARNWPPPNVRKTSGDSIRDCSGTKLLVGLALLVRDHRLT